ncbi:MAG: uracil-DNA glycosylase [Elusimicrobiota bacterium]
MRSELRELVRELRARAELFDDDDWSVIPAPAESGRPAAAEGTAPVPAADVDVRLNELAAQVESCRKCPLGEQRLHPAFGVGSPRSDVMFIGEGPGYEEDRQGEPFVGPAGQLLDKILAAIGLSRETVYIANIVKCHPMVDPSLPEKRGNDRAPTPAEMSECRGYLDEQIRLIRPRVIVTLGGVASKMLIGTETGIMRLRGKWHTYGPADIPLLPTYHPAALLRNPEWKRDVWTDMQNLRRFLENQNEELP